MHVINIKNSIKSNVNISTMRHSHFGWEYAYNLSTLYSRLTQLIEKFDQLRAAGDMLPQARTADGEFAYNNLPSRYYSSHCRATLLHDCFIDIYPWLVDRAALAQQKSELPQIVTGWFSLIHLPWSPLYDLYAHNMNAKLRQRFHCRKNVLFLAKI